MVSIIARPTNNVRDNVLAASGWRAMASRAAATAWPSPRPGPMAPNAYRQRCSERAGYLDPVHVLASSDCGASPTAPPMKTIASTLKM